ncbi:hypothetical protein HanRHA438_Chr02g0083551 [Helianthus annuus]|nr:hypothetical protein HanRHA438_Chr02g0083551 [Helianthus annuus]
MFKTEIIFRDFFIICFLIVATIAPSIILEPLFQRQVFNDFPRLKTHEDLLCVNLFLFFVGRFVAASNL